MIALQILINSFFELVSFDNFVAIQIKHTECLYRDYLKIIRTIFTSVITKGSHGWSRVEEGHGGGQNTGP